MFGKKVPESPLGKSIVNSDNNEKIKDPPYGILKMEVNLHTSNGKNFKKTNVPYRSMIVIKILE